MTKICVLFPKCITITQAIRLIYHIKLELSAYNHDYNSCDIKYNFGIAILTW